MKFSLLRTLLLCTVLAVCVLLVSHSQEAHAVDVPDTVTQADYKVLLPFVSLDPPRIATQVSTGIQTACALLSTGDVLCWGIRGTLGHGIPESSATPVKVIGLRQMAQRIDTGLGHTCAILTDGGVQCWGGVGEGGLGDMDRTSWAWTPVDVSGLSTGVKAIGMGGHSCAVTDSGELKCWGGNHAAQIGIGRGSEPIYTPTDVTILEKRVLSVASGSYHTCALDVEGGLKCWGADQFGQVGDSETSTECGIYKCRRQAVDVEGLASGVQMVATLAEHTCAVTTAGGVKCWGSNENGQLGDGSRIDRATPVDVVGLTSGVKEVAAGTEHTCALLESSGVKCWGWNDSGELGDGTRIDRLTPVDVVGLENNVASIDAGDNFSCAVMQDGGVKCWGLNHEGQLGNGGSGIPCDSDEGDVCQLVPDDVVGLEGSE